MVSNRFVSFSSLMNVAKQVKCFATPEQMGNYLTTPNSCVIFARVVSCKRNFYMAEWVSVLGKNSVAKNGVGLAT